MADNKQIKDGLGNIFTIRMRDLSSAQDGSLQRSMIYATPYPIDYGNGGIFQHVAKSGVMAAALPANSSIYAFQFSPPTIVALVWRVRLVAWSVTAFATNIATFNLYAARNFTVNDSGGIAIGLAGNAGKLRTSMASSTAAIEVANTGGLTPGTRTLDAAPLGTAIVNMPATTPGLFSGPLTLFEKLAGEHPLLVTNGEGFIIQASVPNDGTWQFATTTEWTELSNY